MTLERRRGRRNRETRDIITYSSNVRLHADMDVIIFIFVGNPCNVSTTEQQIDTYIQNQLKARVVSYYYYSCCCYM